MGRLVDGRWEIEAALPSDREGQFVRATSRFRDWVRADGSSRFAVEPGRYHLYAALACPWAHRTLIARALLGLEHAISVSFVQPLMLDEGWVFRDQGATSDSERDPEFGARALWQIYVAADPHASGRVTVPVLWDRKFKTIVNNESREILRMFSTAFRALAEHPRELCPERSRTQIDATIDAIYAPINNGVYRCGFARSQEAYERAARELFAALDHWEAVLARQRFTCGDALTEADICLFTTLFRFDLVYVTHFKCNLHRLIEYPNLYGFARDVYQTAGIAETCNVEHIKQHYFGSHRFLNPQGIIPLGFAMDFAAPHDRAALGPASG